MRKFIALIGVFALLMGIRLYEPSLTRCGYTGTLTLYKQGGETVTYKDQTLPLVTAGDELAARLDFAGEEYEALSAIQSLGGRILWSENFDGVTVIYAYSPKMAKSEKVCGKKVNIMAAVNAVGVSLGSPILMGSY